MKIKKQNIIEIKLIFNLNPLFGFFVVVATPLSPGLIGLPWLIKFKLLTIEGENEPLFGDFNKAEACSRDRPINWLTVKLFTVSANKFDSALTVINAILLAGRVLKSNGVIPPIKNQKKNNNFIVFILVNITKQTHDSF